MTPALPTTLAEERPHVVVKRWPHSPRSVGRARHSLAQHLDDWGLSHLTDTAQLIISELFTNSVKHARKPHGHQIGTRFERLTCGVRIEVHDANDRKPERQHRPADAESGRGLVLVDSLTGGHWGVSNREGVGKMVWAVCADDGTEVPQ